MKPDIELHIDELVIHGTSPTDRRRVGEAVELELARLLRERGIPGIERNVSLDRLDAGSITVSSSVRGETMGAEIARSLYEMLSSPINGHRER